MSIPEDKKPLASALGRIPSGLFILTARNNDKETGMLASWVQQCSFEPPQVTVALSRERPVSVWLDLGAFFGLNILDDSQTDMIGHFGRGFSLDQPAFTGLETTRSERGLPVLEEALAYLECRVVDRFSAGDHDLLVGQVVAGQILGDGHPMVHVRKSGLHY